MSRYNFSLNDLKCEYAGLDLQYGSLDTCGNDLYECLLNAVVQVLDHDGQWVGCIYASDMSDTAYNAAELAISQAIYEDNFQDV